MRNYSKIRLTDSFINLTDKVVHVYDMENGDIISFPPSRRQLPKTPKIKAGRPIVHYIIMASELGKLRKTKRPLDDIALLKKVEEGRTGVRIDYLVWGKNPIAEVQLFSGAYRAKFKHL